MTGQEASLLHVCGDPAVIGTVVLRFSPHSCYPLDSIGRHVQANQILVSAATKTRETEFTSCLMCGLPRWPRGARSRRLPGSGRLGRRFAEDLMRILRRAKCLP